VGLARLGVIGGSGVYGLAGLENCQEQEIATPWGAPSGKVMTGEIAGAPIAFLPRHGVGHVLAPTEVPYLSNLYALRMLGVERVLSVSAVGSLCDAYAPGDFVLPDQFVDRTTQRRQTFFGDGLVAHVPFSHPVSPSMVQCMATVSQEFPVKMHEGGTYVTMEGPQFSTLAESQLYRSWGCKLIGMTNGTEAKLAREAGMEFCTLAMVTDYDCWHPSHGDVDVAEVIAVAQKNASVVADLVRAAVPSLCALGESTWAHVLNDAVMTHADAIPEKVKKKTAALFRDS
jgi:5'-methylthioadenosine phosphorylase